MTICITKVVCHPAFQLSGILNPYLGFDLEFRPFGRILKTKGAVIFNTDQPKPAINICIFDLFSESSGMKLRERCRYSFCRTTGSFFFHPAQCRRVDTWKAHFLFLAKEPIALADFSYNINCLLYTIESFCIQNGNKKITFLSKEEKNRQLCHFVYFTK